MRPAQLAVFALAVLSGIAGVHTIGWVALVPPAASVVMFAVISLRLPRYRRPEQWAFWMWVVGQLAVALGIALAHGPIGYLLIIPVIPMTLSGAIMPVRVGALMTGLTALLILALGLALDRHEVLSTPPVLICPIAVLLYVSMTAATAGSLDISSRETAATDPLTGLPNRFALQPRINELAHQAAATGERVAVVAIDVDHLKEINDEHGHASGDDVLREVARRLRACLAPFDSIYRFGGEEFLVLLAGYDIATASAAAETMRVAVRATPIGGRTVTVSIGVAVPSLGEPFQFDATFARADAALYAAKHAGRDLVRTDTASAADAATGSGAVVRRRRADRVAAAGAELPLVATAPAGWTALAPAGEPETRSWLIGDTLEREHMLDLGARYQPLLERGNVVAFAGIAASGPWFGWAVLGPPILGAANFQWVAHHFERFRRPEYPLAVAWVLMQAAIALGFTLSHGAPLFALTLFVLLVPGTAALFPPRVVAVGLIITALLMTAVALDLDAAAVRHNAAIIGFPLVLLAGAGMMGLTLGRSALGHRSVAAVDQLTGSLNRIALAARAGELEAQSSHNGTAVAIVLGDVDAFKTINDEDGHAAGDRVLEQLAARLRASLRSFESVYRLGGEEFILLLPGVDAGEAAEVAERLRRAIAAAPIEGRRVTMSFGVAATGPGEAFVYQDVFERADAAMLQAKRAGRDRVVGDGVAERG